MGSTVGENTVVAAPPSTSLLLEGPATATPRIVYPAAVSHKKQALLQSLLLHSGQLTILLPPVWYSSEGVSAGMQPHQPPMQLVKATLEGPWPGRL